MSASNRRPVTRHSLHSKNAKVPAAAASAAAESEPFWEIISENSCAFPRSSQFYLPQNFRSRLRIRTPAKKPGEIRARARLVRDRRLSRIPRTDEDEEAEEARGARGARGADGAHSAGRRRGRLGRSLGSFGLWSASARVEGTAYVVDGVDYDDGGGSVGGSVGGTGSLPENAL